MDDDTAAKYTICYDNLEEFKGATEIDFAYFDPLGKVDDNFLQDFTNLKVIKNLDLSEVYEIGENFCNGCINLEKIDPPLNLSKVTKIKSGFLFDTNLRRITLDLSLIETIGNYFMSDNKRLKKVTIRGVKGLKGIGKGFLKNCPRLEKLQFDDLSGLEFIGDKFIFQTEYQNEKLLELDLSTTTSLKEIGDKFLNNNTGLNELKINLSSIEEIGEDFCTGCTSLKEVDLSTFNLERKVKIGNNFLGYDDFKEYEGDVRLKKLPEEFCGESLPSECFLDPINKTSISRYLSLKDNMVLVIINSEGKIDSVLCYDQYSLGRDLNEIYSIYYECDSDRKVMRDPYILLPNKKDLVPYKSWLGVKQKFDKGVRIFYLQYDRNLERTTSKLAEIKDKSKNACKESKNVYNVFICDSKPARSGSSRKRKRESEVGSCVIDLTADFEPDSRFKPTRRFVTLTEEGEVKEE